MEASITIEQFAMLLRSEQEDSALLRVVRKLQSARDWGDPQLTSPGTTGVCWSGWT